jgi:S1-C subfamily serine protease
VNGPLLVSLFPCLRVFLFNWPLAGLALPLAGLAQPLPEIDQNHIAAVAAIEQSIVAAIAHAEPSVVAISRSSPAQPAPPSTLIEDIFGDLRPAADAQRASPVVAAGVIIDPAGLVLTEYLAVREGDEHTITTIDGKRYGANIRAADPRSGLAVLAITPPVNPLQRAGNSDESGHPSFPAIRFGDAAQLRKGQFVIAIGNPYAIDSDGQPTASWGIVTNLARKAPPDTNFNNAPGAMGDYRSTLHHLGTLVQTDAKLGWSAGGGALVNLKGELVGLTTTAATIAGHEQPAGYAIPINPAFRRIIDTLKEGREVEYGMLGVSFGVGVGASSTTNAQVTINEVFPGSPADHAGLQEGDIVTRVGDQPLNDIDAMQLAVSTLPPSTTAAIQFERAGLSATASVMLAKLAVAGKKIVTVRPDSWQGIRVDYSTALEAMELMQAIASKAYDAEGCVLVAEVERGSKAWQAGVRPGMFISHVGANRVRTPLDFHAATRDLGDRFDIRLTQPITPVHSDAGPDGPNFPRPDDRR